MTDQNQSDSQNHPDRERKARDDAERAKRAIDSMGTGNVPHGGDDPQHGSNSNLGQTPMPSETGGKGHGGDTPVNDKK